MNRWIELTERNPDHSSWYVERFRSMAAAGDDLGGEARFIDAMIPRRARVLDAGCGPGRVGSHLARAGHEVVGVDIDPVLIAAAEHDHPGPTWLVADLAELDLPSVGIAEAFDVVVCAGNVLPFLDPNTRRPVLERLAVHLHPGGRIVTGFGSGRDYSFAEFFDDVAQVRLVADLSLASWDLRPFSTDSDFLVAVLSPSPFDVAGSGEQRWRAAAGEAGGRAAGGRTPPSDEFNSSAARGVLRRRGRIPR